MYVFMNECKYVYMYVYSYMQFNGLYFHVYDEYVVLSWPGRGTCFFIE